jgi:hypothetical protein
MLRLRAAIRKNEARLDRAMKLPRRRRRPNAPHIGAALATGRAGKAAFQVGQPHIVRPRVGIDGHRMAALVVGAIDQQTAHAGGAQFSKRNFLRAGHQIGSSSHSEAVA